MSLQQNSPIRANVNNFREVTEALRRLIVNHNMNATAAPTVSDDSTKGFQRGSQIMGAAIGPYFCLDSTEGAAVWKDASTSTSLVYVTDATGTGGTNISGKTYLSGTTPANKVLTGFTSDGDTLTLTVEITGGTQEWQPTSFTVSGGGATWTPQAAVDWTQIGSEQRWTATASATGADTTGTITVTMSDGATTTVSYTRSLDRPAILTVIFANNPATGTIYPSGTYADQTAFKNNDTIYVSGTYDTSKATPTSIKFSDFEATTGQGVQVMAGATIGSGSFSGTISAGAVTASAQHLRCYGAWSGEDGDTTDSTATAEMDDDAPTIPAPTFDYTVGVKPSSGVSGHQGLRYGGTVSVTCSIAAGDRDGALTYSSPQGNVSVDNQTYAATKTWSHNGSAGDWWDSVDGNNARIVTHKNKNDKSTTRDFVIDLEIDFDFDVPAGSGGGTLYQGSQTCVGAGNGDSPSGDTYRLTGTKPSDITQIRVVSNGSYAGTGTSVAKSSNDDKSGLGSGTTFDITSTARTDSIRDAAFDPKTCYVSVQVYRGSWRSRQKIVDNSNGYGSIEVDTQTVPIWANETVDQYPAGQTALKGNETARIRATHTNRQGTETYDYAQPGGVTDFTPGGIPNSSTYEEYKTVTLKNPAVYRVTGTNIRPRADQVAYNGMWIATSLLVKVADYAATITLSNNGEGSPKVFRSRATGGNKTYTITASSDQDMNEITIQRDTADDGPALGAWSGGPTSWTSTITIQEADTKNVAGANYDFEAVGGTNWGKNIADYATTVAPTDTTYRVAGFEQRDISIAQFDEYDPIGTMASNRDNANKLSCEAVGISSLTYKTNTTQNDGGREFTITDSSGNFDADGNNVRCTDGEIFNLAYTLRISESA